MSPEMCPKNFGTFEKRVPAESSQIMKNISNMKTLQIQFDFVGVIYQTPFFVLFIHIMYIRVYKYIKLLFIIIYYYIYTFIHVG